MHIFQDSPLTAGLPEYLSPLMPVFIERIHYRLSPGLCKCYILLWVFGQDMTRGQVRLFHGIRLLHDTIAEQNHEAQI